MKHATLVGWDLSSYNSGTQTLTFDVPGDVAEGDELVAVIVSDDVDAAVDSTPDGWALVSKTDVGGYYVWVYRKTAQAADAGASVAWDGSVLTSPDPSGVLVAVRDAVAGDPFVKNVTTPNPQQWPSGVNMTLDAPAPTQADDLRLLVGWVPAIVTVTPPATVAEIVETSGGGATTWLGEAVSKTPGVALLDNATLSGAAVSVTLALCFRSRPIARAVGATTRIPGTVGLELDEQAEGGGGILA